MQYRLLGKTELKVPVVSYGAWANGGWMWGGTDDAAAVRAMHCAIEEGIRLIDTAPTYGMGHSESVVGKAIAGRRDQALVATKCGIRWDLETDQEGQLTRDNDGKEVKLVRCLKPISITLELEQSLRRLGVDYIDLYQIHWPDPNTPVEESMETLIKLQEQGKIRAIGVSNYSVEMMQVCMSRGTLASDQPKYNPLERDIEKDVLPFCLENGVGVMAYSPIAQGLMTGKVTPERVFKEGDARGSKPLFSVESRKRVLAMLDKIRPIADGHGITLGQLAIAWVVAQPGITTAIVGARDEAQVAENAKAGEVVLTHEELALIRGALEAM